MQKIATLFVRDPDDRRRVLPEVTPGCEWVTAGEGTPTRKYDGTCTMFDGERWWARREVRTGRSTPPNYVPVQHDEVTGKTVGWEPIEQSAFAKYHAEAVRWAHEETGTSSWPAGTYELVGPKVNGDPERAGGHRLRAHSAAEVLDDAPRDFDGLVAYLVDFEGEGIVWHHPDGRMVKLKRRDFAPAVTR